MIKNIQENVAAFILLVGSGMILFAAFEVIASTFSFDLGENPAAVYLVDNRTPEDLRQTYSSAPETQRKLRVFIMPGHEPDYGGAEYGGRREREMNLVLAGELARLLNDQGRYEAVLGRDSQGWNPVLEEYFKASKKEISAWKKDQERIMDGLIKDGAFRLDRDPVPHQSVTDEVALRLYGINRWIGENDFDLAVHVHFNDYGSRRASRPGAYSGFSIYVPDGQYSNSLAARGVAQFIHDRLGAFIAPSNAPREREGIIESQELIALGSNNTADAPSILVEYGYIYEPQFQDEAVRDVLLGEYAYQTFLGIEDFFRTAPSFAYRTASLPYEWSENFSRGTEQDADVLALQFTLLADGSYPPAGKDLRTCPLSGVFGPCTVSALAAFQEKSGIDGDGTRVGSTTRFLLNSLFGE